MLAKKAQDVCRDNSISKVVLAMVIWVIDSKVKKFGADDLRLHNNERKLPWKIFTTDGHFWEFVLKFQMSAAETIANQKSFWER